MCMQAWRWGACMTQRPTAASIRRRFAFARAPLRRNPRPAPLARTHCVASCHRHGRRFVRLHVFISCVCGVGVVKRSPEHVAARPLASTLFRARQSRRWAHHHHDATQCCFAGDPGRRCQRPGGRARCGSRAPLPSRARARGASSLRTNLTQFCSYRDASFCCKALRCRRRRIYRALVMRRACLARASARDWPQPRANRGASNELDMCCIPQACTLCRCGCRANCLPTPRRCDVRTSHHHASACEVLHHSCRLSLPRTPRNLHAP